MNRAAIVLLVSCSSTFVLGCPSKESSSSSGATSPSGSSGAPGPGTGTGPLANMEATPFINEVWNAQEGGAPMPFVYYSQTNVRLSAACRMGNGQLACDAIRYLRNGTPVEVPRRMLATGVSAGTRACQKLGHQLVTGRNSVGAEDGFCRFPDGSMVSTGALEQYGMRVVE